MKRCTGCMEMHEENLEECPYCGYYSDKAIEQYYLKPGTVLFSGRYVVGNVLGRGGFGITYIAWDNIADKKVSIKEYFPSEFSSRASGDINLSVYSGGAELEFKEGIVKFVDEARKLASLIHIKGIIKIFDCFEENNTAYIVMEYLEGESLANKLEREKVMSVDDSINMLLPIMKSLVSVHDEGIVHRDISPDNIMVLKDGTARLLDFGASRQTFLEQTRSLTVIVKSGYSPEEQYISDGNQGAWTDVYAMAATLYRMITGIKPMDAIKRRTYMVETGKDKLPTILENNIKVENYVDSAITNALKLSINDRTKNMSDFIKELLNEDIEASKKENNFLNKINKKINVSDKLASRMKIIIPIVVMLILIAFIVPKYIKSMNNSKKDNIAVATNVPDDKNTDDNIEDVETVIMPQLIGLNFEDVKLNLDELGIKYEVTEYIESNEHEENTVISQDIVEGENVTEDTIVKLTVSQKVSENVDVVAIPEKTTDTKQDDKLPTSTKKSNTTQVSESIDNSSNSTVEEVQTPVTQTSAPQTVAPVATTEPDYSSEFNYEINTSNNTIAITKYIGSKTEVTIPSHIKGVPVVEIGTLAFGSNSQKEIPPVTKVILPQTIKIIRNDAFFLCRNLTSINLSDNITHIDEYAFSCCSSLKSIYLGKKLTYIGQGAFKGSGLTDVIVPGAVETIPIDAFYACTSLKSVKIEKGVKSIKSDAFDLSFALKELHIPNTVTSIGAAFASSQKFTIYYSGTNAEWTKLLNSTTDEIKAVLNNSTVIYN